MKETETNDRNDKKSMTERIQNKTVLVQYTGNWVDTVDVVTVDTDIDDVAADVAETALNKLILQSNEKIIDMALLLKNLRDKMRSETLLYQNF